MTLTRCPRILLASVPILAIETEGEEVEVGIKCDAGRGVHSVGGGKEEKRDEGRYAEHVGRRRGTGGMVRQEGESEKRGGHTPPLRLYLPWRPRQWSPLLHVTKQIPDLFLLCGCDVGGVSFRLLAATD